jgi:hypothetical protein
VAQTLVQVLKQCGDNLTRENVMKQAANLKDFRTTNLLPGIKINTSPIACIENGASAYPLRLGPFLSGGTFSFDQKMKEAAN